MYSKIVLAACLLGSANAFVARSASRSATALRMSEEPVEEAPAAPAYPTLNGWTADQSKFCWGLTGSLAPLGEFDPVGLSKELDLTEMKRYRESEVTHGRVAMLAVLGIAVAENFHPLFGGDIGGPAIYQLDQVRTVAPIFFDFLAFTIALAELYRSLVGWVPPNQIEKYFGGELKEDYYPGDIGFDPLGLKPTGADFEAMQKKELSNGRLAMIAFAGILVQERLTGEAIFSL